MSKKVSKVKNDAKAMPLPKGGQAKTCEGGEGRGRERRLKIYTTNRMVTKKKSTSKQGPLGGPESVARASINGLKRGQTREKVVEEGPMSKTFKGVKYARRRRTFKKQETRDGSERPSTSKSTEICINQTSENTRLKKPSRGPNQ